MKKGIRYHIGLVVIALGSATLFSGCQVTGSQATIVSKAVVQGNTAGASIASIVNPTVAVPATLAAGIGDTLTCGIAAALGGSC